jgi:hypothetical protein
LLAYLLFTKVTVTFDSDGYFFFLPKVSAICNTFRKSLKSATMKVKNTKDSDHVITETTSLLEKIKFGLRSTVPFSPYRSRRLN